MTQLAYSWAAQQLTEYLTALGTCESVDCALRLGVDRAAEAFEAEAGAVIKDGHTLASIGQATFTDNDAEVPGIGTVPAISAKIDETTRLALAREDAFTVEETALLRGMARALHQTLRTLELVTSLRSRQELLERLAQIQRKIVQRDDLEALLNSIVAGAAELIGDEIASLRLVDEDNPAFNRLAATTGISAASRELAATRRTGETRIPSALTGGLVVVEDTSHLKDPTIVNEGIQALMSAPVFRNGVVCGVLNVASRVPGRRYGSDEREVLLAFAEHTSLALTDARNHSDAIHRALHDPLTNLPNRSLFADRLRQAEQRAQRAGTAVGVLFVDLDGFKGINDSLGHTRGDELLIAVGQRLTKSLRAPDTAARIGGDEFAVLLDDLHDEREALIVAKRTLAALRAPVTLGGQELTVRASIGVATAREPGGDLLRDADLAMYQAKAQGRDRVVSFDCGMHAAMLAGVALENDLRRALRDGEFTLAFQPIVDLTSGQLLAAEALLRWKYPPSEFIPLAEETGLIVPIGAWVLETACTIAAGWKQRVPVTVNVSSVQLRNAEFVDQVANVLAATGLNPRRLVLEVTESMLMADVRHSAELLRRLRALGVRIAIDDFGTGHSSLQYLQQLPLDSLKIAKPFIDDLDDEAGEGVLARAILELGRSFRLHVIAEGIETERQRERLHELGCSIGQGYLFAKPLTADGLARYAHGETVGGAPQVAVAAEPHHD